MLHERIRDLRYRRGQAVAAARAILEAAEREQRPMTDDESRQFDAHLAESDQLRAEIERAERLMAEQAAIEASQGTYAGGVRAITPPAAEPAADARGGQDLARAAMRAFIRGGLPAMSEAERRALQADISTAGGFIRPDQQFVASLIQAVDDLVFVRQFATVRMLDNADSIGVPVLDADPSDADWTAELATGGEDVSMVFGRRELRPKPLAKRIKISNKLLRQASLDIEALIRERLAYKFAIPQERAFLSGNGANQPLGVFVASADGISTGRDVLTGSSTAITADSLIDAKYALKGQYWGRPSTRWCFHRDAIRMIRKLKDSQNQYLWQPGLASGQPDTILDIPFVVSEYAPNTFTTGLYVGILGDWSYYHIVESLQFQIQRLVELYAESNQTGFIGRAELDGMPVLEEAFVRLRTN
jgi:HK97 family phage major capsid protein